MPGTDATLKESGGEARVKGEDGEEKGVGEIRETLHDEGSTGAVGMGSSLGTGKADDTGASGTGPNPISAGIASTDTDRLETTARGIVGDERVERTYEMGENAQRQASSHGTGTSEGGEAIESRKGFMDRVRGVRVCIFSSYSLMHR